MTSRTIPGTAATSTSSIFGTRASTTATTTAVASAPGSTATMASISIITSTISAAPSVITTIASTALVPVIPSIVGSTTISVMRQARINHSSMLLTTIHLYLTKSLVLLQLISAPLLVLLS